MVGSPQFMVLLLILMRMSGFILLNPLFSRRGIPNITKVGIVLAMTLILFPMKAATPVRVPTTAIEFGMLLLLEFSLGLLISYVIDVFFFILSNTGAIIDFQMGLSMAQAYDPVTNINAALSGGIFSTFFYLFFFASNGHLALIKIFMTADKFVPYGRIAVRTDLTQAALSLFAQCAVFAVQLSFPMIAIEFLTQIAVGIMTKAIPQVNIFVINIQAKVIIGLIMLIFFCAPMGEFIEMLTGQMLQSIQQILRIMAA